MKKKVAINGFGRIGRLVFRAYLERSNEFNETYEISYINDLADIDSNIHLLKYDSVHGAFGDEIQKTADNKFKVGQNEITVTSEKNPIDINWAKKELM
jgi:glyceraldehyde 3-phosphate dehydrogenase